MLEKINIKYHAYADWTIGISLYAICQIKYNLYADQAIEIHLFTRTPISAQTIVYLLLQYDLGSNMRSM